MKEILEQEQKRLESQIKNLVTLQNSINTKRTEYHRLGGKIEGAKMAIENLRQTINNLNFMLTLEMLKAMPEGTVFAQGTIKNSPEGIYMTNYRLGDNLNWIAKRGGIHDWAIYIHWAENDFEWIKENGDKLTGTSNIKKLVQCDEQALQMYRL